MKPEQDDGDVRRGRPDRRSAKRRIEAVLALTSGKKSVDTLVGWDSKSGARDMPGYASRKRSFSG